MMASGPSVVVSEGTVYYGILASYGDGEATLQNARIIFKWSGAISLFGLAAKGVESPGDCEFSSVVPFVVLTGVTQVVGINTDAFTNLNSVKEREVSDLPKEEVISGEVL